MKRASGQTHMPLILAMILSSIAPVLGLNPPLAENITGTTCLTDADCWGLRHWCIGGACYIPKNRYVSFVPNNDGLQVAFRIVNVDCPDQVGWIGDPFEAVPGEFVSRVVSAPVFRLWEEPVIHVGDRGIVPDTTYELTATEDGISLTNAVSIATVPPALFNGREWGDIAGQRDLSIWLAPDGIVSDEDIIPTMRGAGGSLSGITIPRIDLGPSVPDYCVDGRDVQLVNYAYQILPYPYDAVCVCSQDVDCDDGLFCNGAERCLFGLCYSEDAPCVGQVCHEVVDACGPCVFDPECSDGQFCNGVERCVAGRCVPGESPCQTNLCLEDDNSCDAGPTIAWVP
ncbi:MAG: hypothetical protein IH987_17600, partial [Planctomycetes bacterium]|nr:hypothetical protein [Planctomycetota bacterium]